MEHEGCKNDDKKEYDYFVFVRCRVGILIVQVFTSPTIQI